MAWLLNQQMAFPCITIAGMEDAIADILVAGLEISRCLSLVLQPNNREDGAGLTIHDFALLMKR